MLPRALIRSLLAAVLGVVLCALIASPALAGSRWGAPRALAPTPANNSPLFGQTLFAHAGDDGFDAFGFQDYVPATAIYHQVLSLSRAGTTPPRATDVGGPYFNYFDQVFAANRRGDIAWALNATDQNNDNVMYTDIGTRRAGGPVGSLTRLQTSAYTKDTTPQVRLGVGPNGDVALAWLGTGLQVYAVTGRIGGPFSKPKLLTAAGHRVDDNLDLAAGVDSDGNAMVAWRDVKTNKVGVGAHPGRMLLAQGKNGTFGAPRQISPPGEDAIGPLRIALNDAGDAIIVWANSAVYRPRGGSFGKLERHQLQHPVRVALDPDGVAYIAGPDPCCKDAIEVAARPNNGHFLASHRIRTSGGDPRLDLVAPARGAGVLAWTGFKQGANIPIRVALVGADGRPGRATIAARPTGPVVMIALDVTPKGRSVLAWGQDLGQPFADVFTETGQIDLTAPDQGRVHFDEPGGTTLPYRVRGEKNFSVLRAPGLVPDGAEIDPQNGADLTVARGGTRETVITNGSRFKLAQNTTGSAPTELALTDPLACAAAGQASIAKSSSLKRRLRRLRARTRHKGRFKSKGKYASATVKGTVWDVTDQCDRTTVHVTEGLVAVADFVKNITVDVAAGQSYTAVKR